MRRGHVADVTAAEGGGRGRSSRAASGLDPSGKDRGGVQKTRDRRLSWGVHERGAARDASGGSGRGGRAGGREGGRGGRAERTGERGRFRPRNHGRRGARGGCAARRRGSETARSIGVRAVGTLPRRTRAPSAARGLVARGGREKRRRAWRTSLLTSHDPSLPSVHHPATSFQIQVRK